MERETLAVRRSWPVCGVSARTASGDISTYDDLRMNVSTESGDENRAAPPVGSTWLDPGDVVAKRGRRTTADEDGARGPNPAQELARLAPGGLPDARERKH